MQKSIMTSLRQLGENLFGRKEEEITGIPPGVCGVSLNFLQRLEEEVGNGVAASGVDLVVVKEEVQLGDGRLEKGSTVKICSRTDGRITECSTARHGHFKLPKLTEVEMKERKDWTMADILEFVVLETTKSGTVAFIETMNSSEVGKAFKGLYLCVPRESRFSDVVATLTDHFKNMQPSSDFVWIDIFCLRQNPERNELNHSLSQIYSIIDGFQNRAIYWNSWPESLPLQRSWCVWELYGFLKSTKSFDFIFNPAHDRKFVEDLCSNKRNHLVSNIMEPNIEDSKSYRQCDKIAIDKFIHDEVGYPELTTKIAQLLQNEFVQFTLHLVEKKRQQKSMELSSILDNAGRLFSERLGLHEPGLSLLEEALQLHQVEDGMSSASVGATLHGIGQVHMRKGDNDEALELLKKALHIQESALLGRENPEVATTLHSLGCVLKSKVQYAEALNYLEEAVRIKESLFGEKDHPSLAPTLYELALLLQTLGDYEGAVELYQKVLDIEEKQYGGRENYSVVVTLFDFALALLAKGDFEDALEEFYEVYRILEKICGGRDSPDVASAQVAIADCLNRLGRPAEAQPFLEEAWTTLQSKPERGCYCRLLCVRAVNHRLESRFPESRQDLEQCVEIRRNEIKQSLSGSTCFQEAMFELGKTLQIMGALDEAQETLEEVLAVRQAQYKEQSHRRIQEIEDVLVMCTFESE